MLDLFAIFTKGGIVLWYFQGTGQLLTQSVNELIKQVILQERGLTAAWNHQTLSLQYKLDNEFELVYVVAYQNILKLTYIDKFLTDVQLRFRDMYKTQISNLTLHSASTPSNNNKDRNGENETAGGLFKGFRSDFDELLRSCEQEARQVVGTQAAQKKPRGYKESDKSTKTVGSMVETKKSFLGNLVSTATEITSTSSSSSPPKKEAKTAANLPEEQEKTLTAEEIRSLIGSKTGGNREMRKFESKSAKSQGGGNSGPASPRAGVKKGKAGRKWEGENAPETLDYGASEPDENYSDIHRNQNGNDPTSQYASRDIVGKLGGELKDIEIPAGSSSSPYYNDEENEDEDFKQELSNNNNNNSQVKNQNKTQTKSNGDAGGGIFSSFKSLVGAKTLTRQMMEPAMSKMQEHLVAKNVAAEIAQKICENVTNNLEGKTLGSFQFVATAIKQALHESIVQILTPKKRVDILRDVHEAKRERRPYVIVFCGVNGVGKSTNLAKVSFWLIENSFRVLIAACDTFRSGAVEQLRTHTRHLNALHPPEMHGQTQMVELFEKGYGKDAAAIAHDAINHAKDSRQDVVLIDTAGRMQDNEPLMKELAKLININHPDLVLFVGEALVGNEAVDQVRKFNQSLIDHSSVKGTALNADQVQTIDGIVLTKFDTIDDKVGAAVSMTYTTGQPIVFVGTGQTYSDLKSLNAPSVVQSLLK